MSGICEYSGEKVTHCIFDLDGLLMDTEPIYTKAMNDCAKKFGKIMNQELELKTTGTTGLGLRVTKIYYLRVPPIEN